MFRFFTAATKTGIVAPRFLFHHRRFLGVEQAVQIADILNLVRLDGNATMPTMFIERRAHLFEARLGLYMNHRRILLAAEPSELLRPKAIHPTLRVNSTLHQSNISDSIAHTESIPVIAPFSYAKAIDPE